MASFAPPMAFRAFPAARSNLPSACILESPVIFPAASFILPVVFLAAPFIRSLSMLISSSAGIGWRLNRCGGMQFPSSRHWRLWATFFSEERCERRQWLRINALRGNPVRFLLMCERRCVRCDRSGPFPYRPGYSVESCAARRCLPSSQACQGATSCPELTEPEQEARWCGRGDVPVERPCFSEHHEGRCHRV